MAQTEFMDRSRTVLRHEDIAGGKVRQGFRMGSEYMRPGTVLTREQIMGMPYANRVAMIPRFIEVWPADVRKLEHPKGPVRRMIIHVGAGKYNVVEGVVLNAEPLDKHEAEDLVKEGSG